MKTITLALLCAAAQATLQSDVQPYAGLQFRVQQSFVDLLQEEFFYELPYVINEVLAPRLPKEIRLFLGFFQIKDIALTGFTIDPARGKFTIDEQKRGVMMNWATVKNWNLHFKCLYILFWPFEYSFSVDLNMKDALLDNGLSLQADTHSGAPIVNFFNTQFDLGKSSVHFSGDFVIAIVGWLTNFLKVPVQILVNEFFQPFVNFAINSIIIPDFLDNGLLKIAATWNNKPVDTLIVDLTLPQQPVFHSSTMDVFNDGAVYFQKKGKKFASPSTPMRFQLDDQNLQFVLSSFSMNQLVQTVIDTQLLQVPVNHHVIEELFGVELTTTLLLAVVPELWYNYGHRNVSLVITPLNGTSFDWSNEAKETQVKARALASWYISEDASDTKMDLAFESILDLDIALTLEVTADKLVNATVQAVELLGFNVTLDNLGGSIKNDEQGIEFRLSGSMLFVEAAINGLLARHPIYLPQFQVIDYTVKFDYQDGALGTGIMMVPK